MYRSVVSFCTFCGDTDTWQDSSHQQLTLFWTVFASEPAGLLRNSNRSHNGWIVQKLHFSGSLERKCQDILKKNNRTANLLPGRIGLVSICSIYLSEYIYVLFSLVSWSYKNICRMLGVVGSTVFLTRAPVR